MIILTKIIPANPSATPKAASELQPHLSTASRIAPKSIAAQLIFRSLTFLGLALPIAKCVTFCLGDYAGLDHNGFEDAVRPTKSDPIQPCFV
jgi:hypothetical protein